jgi:predicted lipoprotein with Yx(FWY)xxD motif
MVVKTASVKIDGKTETILTDSNGSPLYYFTSDKSGKVTCTGPCATMWPPLTMPTGASKPEAPASIHGTLGLVATGDGAKQITYNGWPLYTYSKDKASADPTGQGADGHKWSVMTPTVQPAAS